MKRFLLILFSAFLSAQTIGQPDSLIKKSNADTQRNAIGKLNDSLPRRQVATPRIRVVKPATKPAEDSTLTDSLPITSQIIDTIAVDTTTKKTVTQVVKKFTGIDSAYAHFLNNPFLPTNKQPVFQIVNVRQPRNKDNLFYLVAGLVFLLAFIRLVFSSYYANIFRLFFQPSYRQKQTREQLMQSSLPSLLLNLFFILSAGVYTALLVQHYNLLTINFWKVSLYTTASLLLLYVGKYIFITFSGWVFNVKEAADTYIFAVYLINKILGVVLLPFIFVLAFSTTSVISASLVISYLIVTMLFLYRYVVSFVPVRKEMSVSSLHFILYIVAFEMLPLLFIYKSLILFMGRTL